MVPEPYQTDTTDTLISTTDLCGFVTQPDAATLTKSLQTTLHRECPKVTHRLGWQKRQAGQSKDSCRAKIHPVPAHKNGHRRCLSLHNSNSTTTSSEDIRRQDMESAHHAHGKFPECDGRFSQLSETPSLPMQGRAPGKEMAKGSTDEPRTPQLLHRWHLDCHLAHPSAQRHRRHGRLQRHRQPAPEIYKCGWSEAYGIMENAIKRGAFL